MMSEGIPQAEMDRMLKKFRSEKGEAEQYEEDKAWGGSRALAAMKIAKAWKRKMKVRRARKAKAATCIQRFARGMLCRLELARRVPEYRAPTPASLASMRTATPTPPPPTPPRTPTPPPRAPTPIDPAVLDKAAADIQVAWRGSHHREYLWRRIRERRGATRIQARFRGMRDRERWRRRWEQHILRRSATRIQSNFRMHVLSFGYRLAKAEQVLPEWVDHLLGQLEGGQPHSIREFAATIERLKEHRCATLLQKNMRRYRLQTDYGEAKDKKVEQHWANALMEAHEQGIYSLQASKDALANALTKVDPGDPIYAATKIQSMVRRFLARCAFLVAIRRAREEEALERIQADVCTQSVHETLRELVDREINVYLSATDDLAGVVYRENMKGCMDEVMEEVMNDFFAEVIFEAYAEEVVRGVIVQNAEYALDEFQKVHCLMALLKRCGWKFAVDWLNTHFKRRGAVPFWLAYMKEMMAMHRCPVFGGGFVRNKSNWLNDHEVKDIPIENLNANKTPRKRMEKHLGRSDFDDDARRQLTTAGRVEGFLPDVVTLRDKNMFDGYTERKTPLHKRLHYTPRRAAGYVLPPRPNSPGGDRFQFAETAGRPMTSVPPEALRTPADRLSKTSHGLSWRPRTSVSRTAPRAATAEERSFHHLSGSSTVSTSFYMPGSIRQKPVTHKFSPVKPQRLRFEDARNHEQRPTTAPRLGRGGDAGSHLRFRTPPRPGTVAIIRPRLARLNSPFDKSSARNIELARGVLSAEKAQETTLEKDHVEPSSRTVPTRLAPGSCRLSSPI